MQLTRFLELANHPEPRAIPVVREILADLDTPVSAFMKVGGSPYSFLLESVEGGERWGRWSILGGDPALVVRAWGRRCELVKDGYVSVREERDDPLTFLEEQLGKYQAVDVPGLPRFAGGVVGWLSYDAVRWWERLPAQHPAGPDGAPDLCFAMPRSLVVFDNLKHRLLIIEVVLTVPGSDHRVAYQGAVRRIERTIETLRGPLPARDDTATRAGTLTSNFEQAAFEQGVRKIQDYIHAGDAIQVVLSQRFDFRLTGRPLDLYRALRAVNPSPYMFMMRYPEQLVIGASPEVMVQVDPDGAAMVAPIAGTRKRGVDEAHDRALATELLADPKERAEHVMLVDLGRNDLGRVAAAGSVKVHDFMHIQRFSHVMHIVSTVRAQLAEGRTSGDAIRATVPAGTLSGAPKVRAMEILDELEPCARGLYGGAVGVLGFDGSTDLCIAIRTAFGQARDGGWDMSLQVGAGIVADSDPALEFEETLNKAGAVLRALELASQGL